MEQNFDLHSFERFASLFRKMVSTSSLKYLGKTEKCPFQVLRSVTYEIIIAPKQIL